MSESDPRDFRSLGDLLRDAREERGLGLEEVNEATRISVRVLKALEHDDLEAASGPIYARGFVRTLAGFYQLDAEWLGGKLDQLAGETSRPVMPIDDEGDAIIDPDVGPEDPIETPSTGPKWEVESTRVRRVGSGQGRRVSRRTLVIGLVAILAVTIALVFWMGRASNSNGGSARAPARDSGQLAGAEVLTDSIAVEPPEESDAGDLPAFVVEDRDSGPAAIGSVLDEPPVGPPERPAGSGAEDRARTSVASAQGDMEPARSEKVEPTGVSPQGDRSAPREEPAPADDALALPAPERDSDPVAEDSDAEVGDDPVSSGGLPSVLRPRTGPEWLLAVRASGPVRVTLFSDGGRPETRRLVAGELWELEGRDHFSLSANAPDLIEVELDGRRWPLPQSWTGREIVIYPPEYDGERR